ncbi:DUF6252 family protein [Winogradskyella luteola]|uniref:Uncharacterized protein n=1 Tax=Winogradskyella luteola TaxID=2828330 RepID=A0A9X1F9B2_9FLAO|nr:DUF6252 family protein [Winogradskyella luteola]MBV7269897.1 hypothetical protein [Winogradskyella luteola]
MKTLKNVILLIMTMSLITLTSCKSDDDGDGGGNAADGTVVASVDGDNFQSLDISSSATLANNGQNLIIIATNSDGQAINFTIIGYSGEGTYPIGGGANIFNSASYSETDVDINNPQNSTTEIWQAPYNDTQVGEISISNETETKVVGTFSFTAKNTGGDQSVKTISDGAFDLNKDVIN